MLTSDNYVKENCAEGRILQRWYWTCCLEVACDISRLRVSGQQVCMYDFKCGICYRVMWRGLLDGWIDYLWDRRTPVIAEGKISKGVKVIDRMRDSVRQLLTFRSTPAHKSIFSAIFHPAIPATVLSWKNSFHQNQTPKNCHRLLPLFPPPSLVISILLLIHALLSAFKSLYPIFKCLQHPLLPLLHSQRPSCARIELLC